MGYIRLRQLHVGIRTRREEAPEWLSFDDERRLLVA